MYKAYTSYFVSYLLTNLKNIEEIKKIILFGSVARDQATKDSDVDIFIDLNKKDKILKKEIEKIIEEFYNSREGLFFKIKGVENKINAIVGKITEWPDLKKSIESTGIVLYGNYVSSEVSGRKYVIISWSRIEKNRGAFLNKIYGFKIKGKSYKGLLEKLSGQKIWKSSIIIPIENKDEILKLIKHYKVSAKILEVYM